MEMILSMFFSERKNDETERYSFWHRNIWKILLVTGFTSCFFIAVCFLCLYLGMENMSDSRSRLVKTDVAGIQGLRLYEAGNMTDALVDIENVGDGLADRISEVLTGKVSLNEEEIQTDAVEEMPDLMVCDSRDFNKESHEKPDAAMENRMAETVVMEEMSTETADAIEVSAEEASVVMKSVEDANELRTVAGFVYDVQGYIIDCTDAVDVTDGLLVLPMDEECIGIRKGALNDLDGKITDVYIPANICEIEPGTFTGLTSLVFIMTAEGELYVSVEGEVEGPYTVSGEKLQ